jgi:hypothetical protein
VSNGFARHNWDCVWLLLAGGVLQHVHHSHSLRKPIVPASQSRACCFMASVAGMISCLAANGLLEWISASQLLQRKALSFRQKTTDECLQHNSQTLTRWCLDARMFEL